jgi:hypothetical protein
MYWQEKILFKMMSSSRSLRGTASTSSITGATGDTSGKREDRDNWNENK